MMTRNSSEEKTKAQERQKKEIAKAYGKYVKAFTPRPKYVSNCLRAFVVGGAICAAALWFRNALQARGLSEEDAGTFVTITLVALAQLSRAGAQRSDKRPILSDLRDSGAIEQDADVIMFLHREEYYDPNTEDKNIAEVIVAKQRNGPLGTVKLAWLGQYTRFASLQQGGAAQ